MAAAAPGASWRGWPGKALPDAALLLLALLQLWPFLSAFHQSADDNFWHFAVLSTLDRPSVLFDEVRKLAEAQGRVGIFPAMPLVMAGAAMAEYAWGRLLAVGIFGALLLAFCHLAARRFRLPLTRPALLLTLCLTPMVGHHMPPNAFPLLITLPLLGLFGLHLSLAGPAGLRPAGWVAAVLALAAAMLVLEYALVAGFALAILAVVTARPAERFRAARLHGTALALSAGLYLGYRLAFPSHYAGNELGHPSLLDVVRLQAQHVANGTVLPYLPRLSLGRVDLAAAALAGLLGAALGARLLPGLALALRPRPALGILACCAGWAFVNTLPHALTPKYQAWCRAGDCAYVDSRVAALAAGLAAAVALAALIHLAARQVLAARACTLAVAGLVGVSAALALLHNRASARDMAERERAFAVLREAACEPDTSWVTNPAVLQSLGQTIRWHLPPAEVPPAQAYLRTYAEGLGRLGLACRPLPFAPRPWPLEFPGWSPPERIGRWSLGGAAVLRLAGGAGAAGMVLSLAAYVPPGREAQRVVARTGPGPGCTFELSKAPREVFVPLRATGTTTLVLETPEAVSPSAAGDSEDPRRLGVFFAAARTPYAGEAPGGAIDLRRCRG
ncbi:hypothetical protein [Roseomonas populi]|uniref:Glycosyltransferase RgtA/B/C/D-like domain-containing protein n=1 Tax=Roseomonas populi TaxID=3121582 RepID=A0ABT1X658_9PROT|nr:hypothetical protein [Roseomonas pecuniae]MCR0983585.1 hypothetical protein [Roseomonas pecuniae]